jgi:histidine kinase
LGEASAPPPSSGANDDEFLEAVTKTLLGVANASFDARAPRTYEGDRWDVLAFLANSTADEVAKLVGQLKSEREELQRAQAQLIQAEKLSALGRLAASVAHEMNQPLTVLGTMIDLLRMDPEHSVGEHDEDLALMAEAARQLRGIVNSVRAFGMGGSQVNEAVAAELPLRSAHRLLSSNLLASKIHVAWRVESGLPSISADPDRLRQVFINLIANARDALVSSEIENPTIVLGLQREGQLLRYSVTDNGPGIDEQNAARVFEPFFSTKERAQGTGLGLSVAHGIVHEHGGSIALEAASGRGANFVVRIPGMKGSIE